MTANLEKTGLARVFNTPLDETSILGLAMGAPELGMLPFQGQCPAYLHNVTDQIK